MVQASPAEDGLPQLDGVRHRFVELSGVRLHVAEAGPVDGTPVLLVHGWPQNWWCWHRVIAELADDFRCIAPDLRGHGWSEAPSEGYLKERLGDDLLELLDALELERVAFAGHDWGAFIGFLLGMRAPEGLSGVLALSVPHPWPSLRDRLHPMRLASFAYQVPLSTPPVARRLMRSGVIRLVMKRAAPAGTFTERDLEVYDRTMRSAEGARVTIEMYRTFLLRELPRIAAGRYANARIERPVRLIVGERDPIVRGAKLDGFEEHAPHMTVERVPGAGHFLPEERPDLVAERIRALGA